MASLCHQWLKNLNGNVSPLGLNGVSVETSCSLDFAHGKLQVQAHDEKEVVKPRSSCFNCFSISPDFIIH